VRCREQPRAPGTHDEAAAFFAEKWWTRLQPIRTVSEIELDFVVFTQDLFPFQAIAAEAQAMRRLGMTLQAIARALGVSEKTVWKAVAR
jgi:hypothetical protein